MTISVGPGTVAKAGADASDKRSLYMKCRVKFIQEAPKLGEVVVVYLYVHLRHAAVPISSCVMKPVTAKIFDALREAMLLGIWAYGTYSNWYSSNRQLHMVGGPSGWMHWSFRAVAHITCGVELLL